MTGLRHAHQTRARFDSGTETPLGACVGRSEVYDVLFDQRTGPEWNYAVNAARTICGGCPLMAGCFRDNRNEEWVRAIVTGRTIRSQGSDPRTETQKAGWDRHRAARLEELRHLIKQGADIATVCERLNLTRSGLWKWCYRHAREEWLQLTENEPYGNQFKPPKHPYLTTRKPRRRAA